MHKYCDIAVALPVDRTFQYRIPDNLIADAAIGKRAFVPFQNRSIVGYIVGFSDDREIKDVKEMISIIDGVPMLTDEMLKLTRWIADNYFCSWGEAIEAAMPSGIKKGKAELGSRLKAELIRPDDFQKSIPHDPNEEQSAALKLIADAIENNKHETFLLHGITASGKTEVYLQAIDMVIANGRQAIMLVPEISLTPQTIDRFVSRFGKHVAVIHSRLTPARRFLEWKKIKDGKANIVVGARSAIFSPVKSLGLVIIDEEHETTYKQEDVPRYHARDVAEQRSRMNNCPLILGSATPSLEAYHRASSGEYKLIRLTKRIEQRLLPRVKIVDMRMELATRRRIEIFSKVLLDAVDKMLKAGKQAIIFLNRRGFSTFVNCKRCGFVMKCRRCDTALVYHFDNRKLTCHYCGYSVQPPDICPKCRSGYIKYLGLGTEKVESELCRSFAGAHIARMDSDTTSGRGSHDRILGDFKSGDVSMLVGTQMIAKGLDFPKVTLVGVVSADATLNLPDFRSSERTFNLLTQVGGRAGRGDDGGEVIIQTYAPDHYAILAAAKHDYEKFYKEEIVSRKELMFPPFVHLAKITVRARNEAAAENAAKELAEAVRPKMGEGVMMGGPAPALISRMRGYYRYSIMLKAATRLELCALLKKVFAGYRRPGGILIAVDIDPMTM